MESRGLVLHLEARLSVWVIVGGTHKEENRGYRQEGHTDAISRVKLRSESRVLNRSLETRKDVAVRGDIPDTSQRVQPLSTN